MARSFARVWIAGNLVVACNFVVGVAGQTQPDQQAVPKVKSVTTNPIVSIEGKDNFDAYCAVCHGHDGKGQGPAALSPALACDTAAGHAALERSGLQSR
jgi:mono/diheme cytochrome c family protein